jgi:O-antigen ligase
MTTLWFLAPAILAGAAALWCLIYLERTGRRLAVVLFLLVLLVVDSVFHPDPFAVPAGVLHPEVEGLSFRPYEVVIAVALVARAIARPPRRFRLPTILWISFLAWLLVEALVGLYRGHPADLVTFEAKAAVYLGALWLTAGVPYEEWRRSRAAVWLLGASAALSATIVVISRADVVLRIDVPGVREASFGEMGTDTATLFACLGVVSLTVALCRTSSRAPFLVAAGALLPAALVAEQRAAVLGLIVSLLVLVAAWLSRTGGRRFTVTRTEVLRGAAAGAVVLAVPVIVLTASGRAAAVPFRDSLQTVIESKGKEMSAEGRRNQWTEAAPVIREHPIAGHGLGMRYRYYEPSKYRVIATDLTHNIVGDLLLRTGLVGAVLFLLALGASLREGLRAWRAHPNGTAAALALGCVAVVAGLCAKGMVESLFEKFRLATLLGLTLGVMLSLAASASGDGATRNHESAWR